jgi:tRNA threonylcarbamoyladenosine biosynthesis protein TsaE
MKTQEVITRSAEETQRLAGRIASEFKGPAVLALHGELGSGKTCFVKGVARALGIERNITSPTFIIINEHRGRRPLYHVDLYRIRTPDEALCLGLDEYLHADGITVIEWAERAGDLIPEDALHIEFETRPRANERLIRIRGKDCCGSCD